MPRYEAYRRTQPGEISRDPAMWDLLFGVRSRSLGSLSPAFWLLHADGYCAYRMQDGWNLGQPAHVAEVVEFVALTDDARGALWRTMLSIDLVTEVQQRFSQIDDPLPYWLESPRSVRTTAYNDYLWVKPLEPAVLLAARTYGTADRLVVEVGATRWAVDAAGDEVEVRKVRTRPDITVTDAGLGSLLLGGARATTLARVGAMSGEPAAVRRADRFFLGDRLPSSQTGF